MNKAIVSNGWEFHMVNGTLFITSETDPEQQIQLSGEAVNDLMGYLAPNRVEFLREDLDGALIYIMTITDHQPLIVELIVFRGRLEDFTELGDH